MQEKKSKNNKQIAQKIYINNCAIVELAIILSRALTVHCYQANSPVGHAPVPLSLPDEFRLLPSNPVASRT